jgi:hypothetical protein
VKKGVSEKIDNLKKTKDGSDAEAIKSLTAELSQEIQKIGQAMYNKGTDQNPPKENADEGDKDGSGPQEPGQSSPQN